MSPSARSLNRGAGCPVRRSILGDVVVDVPRKARSIARSCARRAETRAIDLDPVVRLYYVEVREPDMHDPSGDLRRLEEALEREWDVNGLRLRPAGAADLQPILRKGEWKVTVAVHEGSRSSPSGPASRRSSTASRSTSARRRSRRTVRYPERRGRRIGRVDEPADPLRRGPDEPRLLFDDESRRRAQMTVAVREALDELTGEVAKEAGVRVEDMLEITMVGNPIMHHLLLGIDPSELGGAPFALATDMSVWLPARSSA